MRIRELSRRDLLASLAALVVAPACGGEDGAGAEGSGGSGGAAGSAGTGGAGAGGTAGAGAGGTSGSAGTGGSGGSGGGGPGPEPEQPWDAPGTFDEGAFGWGIQTGDALPGAVMVGIRTTLGAVTLTVMKGVDGGWEEVSSGTSFTPEDGVVQLELSDLEPDTTYSIAFFSTDGSVRSRVGRFRTALAAGARRVVRFGSTSCLGGSGRPWRSMTRVAGEKLDFLLLLGDTIYADSGSMQFQYVEKWKEAFTVAGLQDAMASTSVIATWDDHEVDNDWSWQSPDVPDKFAEALPAFRQAVPQRLGPGGTGIWRKLSWGATLDVFVLDCRGERRNGNYVSPEQMAWLKQALSESTATFKIMMNSVPIVDFTGTVIGAIQAGDRWQGYPAQRDEILAHIDAQGITGVLWVSGDFHIGGAGLVSQAGRPGASQIEVLTGPAGSNINPAAGLVREGGRILSIVNRFNTVVFEADPEAGAITARFVGDDGSVLREHRFDLVL